MRRTEWKSSLVYLRLGTWDSHLKQTQRTALSQVAQRVNTAHTAQIICAMTVNNIKIKERERRPTKCELFFKNLFLTFLESRRLAARRWFKIKNHYSDRPTHLMPQHLLLLFSAEATQRHAHCANRTRFHDVSRQPKANKPAFFTFFVALRRGAYISNWIIDADEFVQLFIYIFYTRSSSVEAWELFVAAHIE